MDTNSIINFKALERFLSNLKTLFSPKNHSHSVKDIEDLKTASSNSAGLIKLYSEQGDNTDGSLTQKSIKDNYIPKIITKENGGTAWIENSNDEICFYSEDAHNVFRTCISMTGNVIELKDTNSHLLQINPAGIIYTHDDVNKFHFRNTPYVSGMPIFNLEAEDGCSIKSSTSGFELSNISKVNGKAYDTGWVELTCGYGISKYSADTHAPVIRRIGNTVMLRAVLTNSTTFSSHDNILRDIPVDMCPSLSMHYVQQGSLVNRYCLIVETNGVVKMERYGTTSAISVPTGHYIVACATWSVPF